MFFGRCRMWFSESGLVPTGMSGALKQQSHSDGHPQPPGSASNWQKDQDYLGELYAHTVVTRYSSLFRLPRQFNQTVFLPLFLIESTSALSALPELTLLRWCCCPAFQDTTSYRCSRLSFPPLIRVMPCLGPLLNAPYHHSNNSYHNNKKTPVLSP